MGWSPDTAFLKGLDFFSLAVAQRQPSDWERASPCSGWTALDVLGHVGTAVDFGTRLIVGEPVAWAPSDPPGASVVGPPHQWWDAFAASARLAVAGADLERVVTSPQGDRTIGEGLSFPALDLFVHAWDLSRSVGAETEIPNEAIEFAHGVLDSVPSERLRNPRVFSASVVPPANANPTEEFIAWTGRDPHWAPPVETPA